MLTFIPSAGSLDFRRNTRRIFRAPVKASVDFSPLRRPHDGSVIASLIQALKPRPVLLARRPLEQPFAVLLMRSAYEAVDELDVVAMDQFQKAFFERRQEAWSHYVVDNANSVKQGVLTDPRYFDFISYAQFVTITDCFADPQSTFVEAFNAAGDTRVVRREESSPSSSLQVLAAFEEKLGNALVSAIVPPNPSFFNSFRDAESASACPLGMVVDSMQELYSYFYICGYCLNEPKVYLQDQRRGVVSVEIVGACTLWGQKCLSQLAAIPNDYDVFAASSLLRTLEWGVKGEVSSKYSDSTIWRRYQLYRLDAA